LALTFNADPPRIAIECPIAEIRLRTLTVDTILRTGAICGLQARVITCTISTDSIGKAAVCIGARACLLALAGNSVAGQATHAGDNAAWILASGHTGLSNTDSVSQAIGIVCANIGLRTDAVITPLCTRTLCALNTGVHAGTVNASTAFVTVLVRHAIGRFETPPTVEFTDLQARTIIIHSAARVALAVNTDIATALVIAHTWTRVRTRLRDQIAGLSIRTVVIV
tara:strand:+ start:868 stop:1542 length:675 start_codon:yes stop_codon:yes gene_type:complete